MFCGRTGGALDSWRQAAAPLLDYVGQFPPKAFWLPARGARCFWTTQTGLCGRPGSMADPTSRQAWQHRRPDSCCYLACLQAW